MQDIVIIRAFGGEPLQRIVVDVLGNRILVANPDSLGRIQSGESSPLALPRSEVFEWDANQFQRLAEEWRQRGVTDATSWRSLRAWSGRARADA